MRNRSVHLLRAVDLGERVFLVLLAIPFALAFAKAIKFHPSLVFVTLSELLGVALILTRRSGYLQIGPLPVVAAFGGTALPLLVRPGGGQLLPFFITGGMMWSGLTLSLLAKIYLNRSFGLIAANRGIKVSGPYRLVRHPMYLGYIIAQIGFLLASFSTTNLLLYLATWTLQLVRVREEEAVLNRDPQYRRFAEQVECRLIPGVY